MPRYFFHVRDGADHPDEVGVEFPNQSAARSEAIQCAGESLKDIDGALPPEGWHMHVTDENGRVVLTLRFSENQPDA